MEHFESLYPANTREKEITIILSYIKAGNSCQIISLPGAGRSNLLGLLAFNKNIRAKHLADNQKWFRFVLCNFTEVKNRSLLDTVKFLFLNLIASLRERGLQEEHQKTVEIFKRSLGFNDELVLFQGLKRTIDLLSIEKELTVVFLFDKFEDYIPTVSNEFFTNLRALRDRAKYRFSVVFSVHKALEDAIGPEILSDFYQFAAGNIIYLPLLDKPGLDFRISYIEKASGKKLEKETVDKIIKLTSGHANLTRLAVETILATSHQQLATSIGLEKFLLEQKSIKSALFDTWKSLTPEEQSLLKGVIPNSFRNLDQKEILKPFGLAQGGRVQDDNNGRYLENIGLVKDNKINIPLFELFIKKEIAQTMSKAKQKIIFDPSANEIRKGNVVLSDTLTSSEFKLLKLLLQNSEKVIEREEIINTVWEATKSTAGVTDQALDQLIFRLRRKIEDNPNEPKHLQTVKGRGLRFLP